MPKSRESVHDATLLLGDGRTARLSDYRGRWLVVYFYPKDNTPGCTLEGIDFNANLAAFRVAGAEVLGVSRDSVKSHAGFCAKHGFGFDLASDPDDVLGKAFDVIHEKSLYGRRFIGVVRSTFLLDPLGAVRAEWRGVKVNGHAAAVLAELQRLQAGGASPAAKIANKAAKKAVAKKPAARKPPAKKATATKSPPAKQPARKKAARRQ
jgi:thioredoxin-dependent peroxiredoxin